MLQAVQENVLRGVYSVALVRERTEGYILFLSLEGLKKFIVLFIISVACYLPLLLPVILNC
jgi:hypothetical protein